MTNDKIIGKDFVLIEASKLSLTDSFMEHKPQTLSERGLKKMLLEAINCKVKDFWRPIYDPSLSVNGDGISFCPDKMPICGKSYKWWKETAKKYAPERGSRIGTRIEYVAFLGVLMKALVEKGYSVEDVWNMFCNDSVELGHYHNSKNSKYALESTGSREICGFFDLANTCKILTEKGYEEHEIFWIASSSYDCNGAECPINSMFFGNALYKPIEYNSVAWIVLEQ